MTKDVLVSVRGIQHLEGDGSDEPMEIITRGQYFLKNGHHYISYEENFEGIAEPARNLVKLSRDTMEVRKKGAIDVCMVFEENKKNISYYRTPFGTTLMGIAATSIRMKEEEDQLDIHVNYALEMNEIFVADCEIDLHVQSARKGAGDFALC